MSVYSDDQLAEAYRRDEIDRYAAQLGQPARVEYADALVLSGEAAEVSISHSDLDRAVSQLAAERGQEYTSVWDAVRFLAAGQNDADALADAVAELAQMPEAEVLALTSATDDLSFNDRRDLARKGHSLPDFSFPIKHRGHLQAAAILAAGGHGDVGEARKLIIRRAKDLGVDHRTLPGFGPAGTGGSDSFGSSGEGGACPSGGGDSAMTARLDDGIMQLAAGGGPVGEITARHPEMFAPADEDPSDTRQPRRGGRHHPGASPVDDITARHPDLFGDVNRQRPAGSVRRYPAKSAETRQREETRALGGGRRQNPVR